MVDIDTYKRYKAQEILDNKRTQGKIFSTTLPLCNPTPGHKFCIIKRVHKRKTSIIGTLLYAHKEKYQTTKLIDINIHKRYRQRGYGTKIIKLVIDQARKFNSIVLSLFVFSHRKIAIHIYQKLGFTEFKKFDKGVSMFYVLN